MPSEIETIRVHCGECNRHTNHRVIAKRTLGTAPEEEFQWGENHHFCQCAGCDSFCYAISEWSEDDWNPHTGEVDYRWRIFPRSKDERHPIDDVWDLPNKVRIIYLEIMGAVNAKLPVLSAIGLRALIEALCKDQGVIGKNLENLIDGLATNGILSEAQASILHSHRFLGNVAAHEIESAKPKEVLAALEIAETMLRAIYVLPGLSDKIKTGKTT
jgi:hypothetical protein